MPDPLVSVCIPAYGRPRELGEAIGSVLAQTHADLEVVVGDDSGDLGPVAAAAGDSRVRYVRNPRRLGMAGNWNATLDRARGRYLALLMDDDRLLPAFVERTLGVLEADPAVGVAFTNHLFETAGGRRTRDALVRGGRHDDFLPTLLERRPVAVSAALFRREVWEAVRPLPDLLAADLVLQVRVALAGWPFHYVDEPLMVYRVHAGQLTGSPGRFRRDVAAAWESFRFDDPACEALRRRELARALVGRGSAELQDGRLGAARRDLRQARALGAPGVAARALVLATIARSRGLSRAATLAHRLWTEARATFA